MSDGRTGIETILDAEAGETVVRDVDLVFGHDATMPLAIRSFRNMGFEEVFDPDRVRVFFDHAYPAPNTEVAELQATVRRWADDHGIRLEEGQGICHQRLAEEGVPEDGIVLGGDSHTNTLGALGAYATGVGSTDLAVAIGTGRTWLTVPGTLRVDARGRLGDRVGAKDLALTVLGEIGMGGAEGRCLTWGGACPGLDLADRLTLANLSTEAGAETSLVTDHDGSPDLVVDLDDLVPKIACHPRPDDVRPVEAMAGTPVDQVLLGSCTNARFADFARFAAVLGDRDVRTRTIAVPASRDVMERVLETGIHEQLTRAGVSVQSPGCGPCLGRHQGVLADGEVALTTTNRNYVGRMGSPEAEIHLASPATAAATAAAGEIADPRHLEVVA